MPHHVAPGKVAKGDVFDAFKNAAHTLEAGIAVRQVDLGHVTRDNHFRIKAQTRKEHLHLLRRGVLRFVENDEAIVERATSHECERRDFDNAAFDELAGSFHIGHIEQRVVERANVGIDFLGKRAWQKAQVLARLDHGARENDAIDFLALERGHRHSHCQIGFARACRTNAERYRVFANRVDIALLARGFRTNRAAAIREQNIFAQNARREFALAQKFDGAARVIDRRVASRGGHFNEIAEQSREALHFRSIARKRNGIASNRDARGKRPLHLTQHAIGRAHDLLHAHPFGQRKRDLRFVGRDGIVAHGSPFDVHLQNDFIVSKHIEALVKGASKQGGWKTTWYATSTACVFDEIQIARDARIPHTKLHG